MKQLLCLLAVCAVLFPFVLMGAAAIRESKPPLRWHVYRVPERPSGCIGYVYQERQEGMVEGGQWVKVEVKRAVKN